MIAKTQEEIVALRKAGRMLGEVLAEIGAMARAGITTATLDLAAERGIRERGGVPVFLGYKPDGAKFAYPAASCISINDEVVHGIPHHERALKRGDIVSIDLGLSQGGFFVDAARTVCVANADEHPTSACDAAGQKLMDGTLEALAEAIRACRVGGHIGDIGAAVTAVAQKYKLGIVEDLGGHAVGRAVHEQPFIANDGKAGTGPEIVEGMVLAIEPMLAEGKGAIILDQDEWTYRMEDGSRAAHFEDTVLVTKQGPEILTRV